MSIGNRHFMTSFSGKREGEENFFSSFFVLPKVFYFLINQSEEKKVYSASVLLGIDTGSDTRSLFCYRYH